METITDWCLISGIMSKDDLYPPRVYGPASEKYITLPQGDQEVGLIAVLKHESLQFVDLPATYRNITILHKQVQATHRVFDLGFEVAYLCKGALPLPSLTSKPEPKLFFTPGPSREHHRLAMAIAFRRSPNVLGRFSFHWQLNSVAAKKKPALTHVRR